MNHYNIKRESVRKLRAEVERLRQKGSATRTFLKVAPMIVSLVVAGIGAYTGWQAYRLQRNAFDMNMEPILTTGVRIHAPRDTCSIYLRNEGISEIVDISIKKYFLVFFPKFMNLGGFSSRDDWRHKDILASRDSIEYHISREEIGIYMHNLRAVLLTDSIDVIGAVTFSIRFRRLPDKKLYRKTRYAFVVPLQSGGAMLTADDDWPLNSYYRNLRETMDSLLVLQTTNKETY